ncbi:MAG: hypothetical protein JXB49_25650 [Bacteroidales bacterium]|nr:hypothetical protein [Bacteroidales bacterium]
MKLNLIQEPNLEFGQSICICPRKGITEFDAYDIKFKNRKQQVQVGVIGSKENLDKFSKWIDICKSFITSKPNNKQPSLFTSFPGFNSSTGFHCELITDNEWSRTITKQEISKLIDIPNWDKRIEECVKLYLQHIEYLAIDKGVDLIVCIVPISLAKHIMKQTLQPVEELIDNEKSDEKYTETDFRRALKAKSMFVGKPIQLMLQDSLDAYRAKSGRQDDATKAWNFFTALYYKTNHIPWRLIRDNSRITSCFAGISFYKTRDRKSVHTSLAQLFDDLGNGVILRGSPVEISKEDRQPHLDENHAYSLIKGIIQEYTSIHHTNPARLVLHKTSNYNEEELSGFQKAIEELRVAYVDYITILDSNTRLFRNGMYPIQRGTHIEIDDSTHLLFTKGSIDYYQTYPGLYVPRPIEIRIVESEESAETICEEILSLTKMNWNNTQLDGKYPITIECARKVGLIMKYIPQGITPQSRYSFYM